MKLASGILSAFAILAPTTAHAEVQIMIKARIAAQCQIIAVDAAEGSAEIAVRTACNVENFQLNLDGADHSTVEAASATGGIVSSTGSGSLDVSVENPGFQMVTITLSEPLATDLPTISLTA